MGHQAGDRLLQEIAGAIMSAGRESDRVFRYGGDEISLILSKTDHAGAHPRRRTDPVGGRGRWRAGDAMGDGPARGECLDRRRDLPRRRGRPGDDPPGCRPGLLRRQADRPGLHRDRGQGLALAGEFKLQEPTPVDPPSDSV